MKPQDFLRFSRITHHASRITHHASRITHHASRITYHALRITHYVSRITHHALRITHYALRITYHALRITYHALRLGSKDEKQTYYDMVRRTDHPEKSPEAGPGFPFPRYALADGFPSASGTGSGGGKFCHTRGLRPTGMGIHH
ncbi:hypothetical protein QUF80_15565 [Desulfococcaceae bacterium HSG8]|nr:hypothetical protein [Desulfococcaceae bacterium HSG8]